MRLLQFILLLTQVYFMILDNQEFPALYVFKVEKLEKEEFSNLVCFADEYIKVRLETTRVPEQKKDAMLLANVLRKFLIKKHFGISPEKQEIFFNENGKPFLKNENVFFNVSHSGDFVACVVGTKNVGVDVQKIATYKKRTAEYIFDKDSADKIEKAENKNLEYTKQWAKLESFLKLKGTGFVNYKKGNHENVNQQFYFVDDHVISVCYE